SIILSTNSTNLLYLKYLRIENSELQSDGHNAETTMFCYEERYFGKNVYKLCGAQNNRYISAFSCEETKYFNEVKVYDDNNFYFLITVYLENTNGDVYKNTIFNELKYYKIEYNKVLFYNYGVYEESCMFEIPLTSSVNVTIEFKIKQAYIYS
ncbi:MAG: hypothetical protein ACI4TT_04465, partial [Christensenellales bacterium]